MDRAVEWEGFFNARDLGGLPTRDGEHTEEARIYRSATLQYVTAAGWEGAYMAGVRTVVSLLNDDEATPQGSPSMGADARMTSIRVATDATEDAELWRRIDAEGLDNTPLYFVPLLDRHPDRVADAVRAVAGAGPGGVLIHCGAGRDRTGLVSALLLRLAGATDEAIITDYVESAKVLPALAAAMGRASQQHLVDDALQAHGHTARSAMQDFLTQLDAHELLRRGGLDDADFTAAADRLRA